MRTTRARLVPATLAFCLMAASFVTSSAAGAATDPPTRATWHLDCPDHFLVAPPPAEASRQTRRELRELLSLKDERTRAVRRSIRRWNRGPATLPWTDVLLEALPKDIKSRRPGFSARTLAIFH